MTADEFWDHIRATRRKDADDHAERLTARLAKLPADECLDFEHWWQEAEKRAFRWNLWGAAYTINGGCSDDGFHYFCGWLTLQGRAVFEAAVADPDTLADVVAPDDDDLHEVGGSPGADAWFVATGTTDDDAGYETFEAAYAARHPRGPDPTDLGDEWDHDSDDEVRRRFPRLAAMYLPDDE